MGRERIPRQAKMRTMRIMMRIWVPVATLMESSMMPVGGGGTRHHESPSSPGRGRGD